jgi:membrane protease YdiL (CAAX protease family)
MVKVPLLSNRNDRFGKLIERQDGKDFPFYNDKPLGLAVWQWLVVWLSAAVGFAALVAIPQHSNVEALIPRILFVAIPLATLAYFVKGKWKLLFQKPTFADYRTMIGFFLLNLAVTLVVGLLVKALFGANANSATDGLAHAGAFEIIAFYVGTGIQLMGEEVFTVLPFLAIMYFFYKKGGTTRKQAIVWAWILTALWFGAAHLPTYGWNIAQAILIIGTARIVLTLAYIRTKNLWVSYGAHLLNDWVIFTFTLVATLAASK